VSTKKKAGPAIGLALNLLMVYFAVFGGLRTTLGKQVGPYTFGLFRYVGEN